MNHVYKIMSLVLFLSVCDSMASDLLPVENAVSTVENLVENSADVQQMEEVLTQALQNILQLSKNNESFPVSQEQLLAQLLVLSNHIDDLKNSILVEKCGCHHNKTRTDVLVEKCSFCGGKSQTDTLADTVVERCGCHHNKTRNDCLVEKCPFCDGKTKVEKLVEKCLSCAQKQSQIDALAAQTIRN